MLEQHQSESALLAGSSTRNERIERMWRDAYSVCRVLYADLFTKMEADGKLSCLYEVDLFCLHSVFVQRINDSFNFVECWNNHPLSTS